MRTLRLSAALVVLLALLGGLAYAVVAQEDEPTTPANVTSCYLAYDFGTVQMPSPTDVEGRVRETYQVEAEYGSSDPRLAGRATEKVHRDQLTSGGDRSLMAQAIVIENEGGTWQGEGHGYDTPDGHGVLTMLRGSGAYEGLSALIVRHSNPTGGGEFCSGLIFEGDLPPMPIIE